MAHNSIQLPCGGDGACMRCKVTPPMEATLTCSTCATPWHVACLASPPETLASTLQWHCPDCSGDPLPSAVASVDGSSSELFAAIKLIEADESLTDKEKARKRQELVSGRVEEDGDREKKGKGKEKESSVLDVLDGSLNCSFCMQLPDRPVTVRFLIFLTFCREMLRFCLVHYLLPFCPFFPLCCFRFKLCLVVILITYLLFF